MEWRVVLVMKLISATGCNKLSKGFTLIEILIVLIIIGIASSLIFLNFSSASSISKNQSSFQNAFNFLTEESIVTGNIIGWHANNENEFSYVLDYKNTLLSTNLDLDYVETLIRERFLFGKKNETIYIIKNNDN